MTKTTATILFIGVVILIIAGIMLLAGESDTQVPENNNVAQQSISPAASPAPENSQTPEQSPAATLYTTSQVALHANAQSCWTIIRGEVYDLTPWINQHPGGSQAILQLCGTDGTAKFQAQHGGSAPQENALATFKIGVVAQ